jgi:hypothetical protein
MRNNATDSIAFQYNFGIKFKQLSKQILIQLLKQRVKLFLICWVSKESNSYQGFQISENIMKFLIFVQKLCEGCGYTAFNIKDNTRILQTTS